MDTSTTSLTINRAARLTRAATAAGSQGTTSAIADLIRAAEMMLAAGMANISRIDVARSALAAALDRVSGTGSIREVEG